MTTLHLDQAHETLLLVPHMLGYRPRHALTLFGIHRVPPGAEGKWLEGEVPREECLGPLLTLDLDKTPIDSELGPHVIDAIHTFGITHLSINWFGENLVDAVTSGELYLIDDVAMLAQLYIDLAIRRRFPEDAGPVPTGAVSAYLTDFTHWAEGGAIADRFPSARFLPRETESAAPYIPKALLNSYADLADTQLAAELVYHGSAPSHTQPELPRPPVSYGTCNDVARELAAIADVTPNARTWNRVLCKLAARPVDFSSADEFVENLGAQTVARMLHALGDIHIRDRILLFAVNSSVDRISGLTTAQTGELLATADETVLNRERLNGVVSVLNMLTVLTAPNDPVPTALIAYLAWWEGKGELARLACDAALGIDASYTLAQLVNHALSVQLPPPWLDQVADAA